VGRLSAGNGEDDPEVPHDSDTVGAPIWPVFLRVGSGERLFSVPQLVRRSGDLFRRTGVAAEASLKEGHVQPWLAPQCPNCDAVWVAFLGEDDVPESVHCPFCGEATPEWHMDFYLVYEWLWGDYD